jgi:hypothetical protein
MTGEGRSEQCPRVIQRINGHTYRYCRERNGGLRDKGGKACLVIQQSLHAEADAGRRNCTRLLYMHSS